MSTQSENITDLAKALAKAQHDLGAAKKDGVNPHFKSSYATLQSVWESAKAVLSPNGLSISQTFEPSDGRLLNITTTMLHSSGQWIKGTLSIAPQQATPQGIGSAITYGRRYALAAILGIVADEDDDGNEGSGLDPRSAKTQGNGPTERFSEPPKQASVPRDPVPSGSGADWRECPVPKFLKKPYATVGEMPESDLMYWQANFTPKLFRGALNQGDVDFKDSLDAWKAEMDNDQPPF